MAAVQDRQLAVALAANLDGAFERFVRAYQDRIYAFALGIVNNTADAEEVAQDSFVRAYRALQRYPVEQTRGLALRPWLYQIALNLGRNKLRSRRDMALPLEFSLNGKSHAREPADDERERPEQRAVARVQAHELRAAIDRLPENFRHAVVLRHVAGLPYSEAAEILRQPVGTVKANVHRGMRMLRTFVAGTFHEDVTHA